MKKGCLYVVGFVALWMLFLAVRASPAYKAGPAERRAPVLYTSPATATAAPAPATNQEYAEQVQSTLGAFSYRLATLADDPQTKASEARQLLADFRQIEPPPSLETLHRLIGLELASCLPLLDNIVDKGVAGATDSLVTKCVDGANRASDLMEAETRRRRE